MHQYNFLAHKLGFDEGLLVKNLREVFHESVYFDQEGHPVRRAAVGRAEASVREASAYWGAGLRKHGPRLSIDEDPNIRLSQTPTTRRGHCSRLLGNDLLPFVLRSLYYTGKGGEIAAGGRASLADGFGD